MDTRHLLPDEIDQLVDGEAGFGVAPLRAHLAECDTCRARLAEVRLVASALESLPHFAPDGRLADRVMRQVPVFIPVHVAARDTMARWTPRSATARALAAVAATSMAGALTLAIGWVALRGDAAYLVGGLALDHLRDAVALGARQVAASLLGDAAIDALRSAGPLGASLLVLGFVAAGAGTVLGVRRLATATVRRD